MKAEIIIDKNFEIGEIDKRIYGSFIEHIGRAVYTGIYEPEHETADKDGFRQDTLELINKIDVPIIRYPGGNFVSGYLWEEGTGDKAKRPQRIDLAWQTIEPNEVGIDEFQDWIKKANSEIMMAVNLGTRGPQDAQNLLEYCNLDTDTYYAKMRKENGFQKPFGIKTWCLGNEMDGEWQICHKTAEEYGRIAKETAKLMKLVDPDIELAVCGSAKYEMDTFGSWETEVLDHTYDYVDYLSMHHYYDYTNNNTMDYLGRGVHMDHMIKLVEAMCDTVGARKHSHKVMKISFDEWNVSYHECNREKGNWQIAPEILEEAYTLEDALVVGTLLMALQNNCDRIKIACLAQLVNVIAPIMTEKGGKTWAQTIFYPYMLASRNGRGKTLRAVTKSDTYKTTDDFTVPYIATSVINNEEKRELVVFAVNRSLDEDMELKLTLTGFDTAVMVEHIELYNDDIKCVNTKDRENVSPKQIEFEAVESAQQKALLKKHSWNMLRFKY